MGDNRNKAEILTHSLSRKEAILVEQRLTVHKRKSLLQLFRAIRSTKGKPISKELVYKQTFGKPFSSDKDYLLRNELRILSSEIASFLAEMQQAEDIKKQPHLRRILYLRSLLNRGENELFEKEWPGVLAAAEKELDQASASKVLKLVVTSLVESRKATLSEFQKVLEAVEKLQSKLESEFIQSYLFSKLKEAYIRRTMQALGDSIESTTVGSIRIEPSSGISDDPLSQYYMVMANSFAETGDTKIDLLLKGASSINRIPKNVVDHEASLASIYAGIALEYFLQNKLEESLEFHHKALEHGSQISPERKTSYIFNYVSTLIRLERHQKAIDLMEEYRSSWEPLPRMRHRFRCLKAMCHVFEGQLTEASDCIPEDRKAAGIDHYYYFRVLHIIILYEKRKFDLALTETENVEHTVRYNDGNVSYLNLTQRLRKLILLSQDYEALRPMDASDRIKQLNENAVPESGEAMSDHSLLYAWLDRAIQRLGK